MTFKGEFHAADPKRAILDRLGGVIPNFTILGARILVAIYERPEMTSGGIIRPDAVKAEDKWQGKVGLIIAKGPLAFEDDQDHRWGTLKPKVGDWVLYRVGDTFHFALGPDKVNDPHFRIVEDVNIHAILQRPDVVW